MDDQYLRIALLPAGAMVFLVFVKLLCALVYRAMPDNRVRAFLFKVRW